MGRGLTEHQHVDSAEVDIIVGSMAGALAGAGGFCAGSDDVVEHQRISAAAYTFSAALPAMAAVTVSETLMMLQTQPDLQLQLKENVRAMWGQIDPRSDWVYCSSAPENPIMLLVLKPEVVSSKRLGIEDQQHILQDVVDEVRISLRLFEGATLTSYLVTLPGRPYCARQVALARSQRSKSRGKRGSACPQSVPDDWTV